MWRWQISQSWGYRNLRLSLKTGYYLNLKETFAVSCFRRNLVSISTLDKFGYSCSIENSEFDLFLNSNIVGTNSLSGYYNIYLLNTVTSYKETLHVNSYDIKHKLINKNFVSLWHKRLCNISQKRMKNLVSEGIVDSLNFSDLSIYINYIKGKPTNIRRLGANRTLDVLELIHTDICKPFTSAFWNCQH